MNLESRWSPRYWRCWPKAARRSRFWRSISLRRLPWVCRDTRGTWTTVWLASFCRPLLHYETDCKKVVGHWFKCSVLDLLQLTARFAIDCKTIASLATAHATFSFTQSLWGIDSNYTIQLIACNLAACALCGQWRISWHGTNTTYTIFYKTPNISETKWRILLIKTRRIY